MKYPLAIFTTLLEDPGHVMEYRLTEETGEDALTMREYIDGTPVQRRRLPLAKAMDAWNIANIVRRGGYGYEAFSGNPAAASRPQDWMSSDTVAVSCLWHRCKIHSELHYHLLKQETGPFAVSASLYRDGEEVDGCVHELDAPEGVAVELLLACACGFVFPASMYEILESLRAWEHHHTGESFAAYRHVETNRMAMIL